MPFPISGMTRKDETAEKIPTKDRKKRRGSILRDERRQRKLRSRESCERSLTPTEMVPEVEPLAPELERDPENPRICGPECPSYRMKNCVVHNRQPPSRPTSPGLLAI
ncbi:hypothetical protein BKA59DRAFT_550831 [Fusarium tricinctum]|uniref:Uncharacterized protein n=1 Tax=Fusarium tricinctum TaxID=61284 RepID=A0A8K0S986_9HYPO|nr:hypothetical protein BKA59DRAFT_550831 [Fusarium tricinctum]